MKNVILIVKLVKEVLQIVQSVLREKKTFQFVVVQKVNLEYATQLYVFHVRKDVPHVKLRKAIVCHVKVKDNILHFAHVLLDNMKKKTCASNAHINVKVVKTVQLLV